MVRRATTYRSRPTNWGCRGIVGAGLCARPPAIPHMTDKRAGAEASPYAKAGVGSRFARPRAATGRPYRISIAPTNPNLLYLSPPIHAAAAARRVIASPTPGRPTSAFGGPWALPCAPALSPCSARLRAINPNLLIRLNNMRPPVSRRPHISCLSCVYSFSNLSLGARQRGHRYPSGKASFSAM